MLITKFAVSAGTWALMNFAEMALLLKYFISSRTVRWYHMMNHFAVFASRASFSSSPCNSSPLARHLRSLRLLVSLLSLLDVLTLNVSNWPHRFFHLYCVAPAAVGFPVIILLLIPLRTLVVPRLPFSDKELEILDQPTAEDSEDQHAVPAVTLCGGFKSG